MRLPLLLLLLIAFATNAQQNTLPEFGKISKEELTMKECSFEKDASAMYLINEESVSFKADQYSTRTVYDKRARIKIFNKSGYEWADVLIKNGKSRSSKVTDIDAYVYNLMDNGQVEVEKVNKDQIFKEKENGKRKTTTLRFTFPDLKPGSVIEYRYTQIVKNTTAIEPWFFQNLIPVQISLCKINTIPEVELKTKVIAKQLAEEDSSIDTEGSNSRSEFKQFVVHKIPSFKEEPYMSSLTDNLERVEFFMYPRYMFFLSGSPEHVWNFIGSSLKSIPFFGGQFDKPIEGTESAIDSIKKLKNDSAKINAVYELVKQNVKWNNEQVTLAEDIENAWKTKSGSSAEINLLILNLLRKTGVKCKPILISTRDNGEPDMSFPNPGQFNGVDVFITDSIYNFILDGTQKYQSYLIPPFNILNSYALLIDSQSTWVSIADDRYLMNSSTFVQADLDSEGTLHGTAQIIMKDYAKAEQLKEKDKDENEKKEEQKDFMQYDNPDIKIDTTIENDSVDATEPLLVKLKFHYALSGNENFYFLNPSFFAMFRKNPFTSNERNSDIDFGCAQHFLTYLLINIPDNFSVEDVPRNVILRTTDTSISLRRDVSYQNNQLGLRYDFKLNNPQFQKSNYAGVKEFFDKIYGIINTQILLKKKE